MCVWRWGGGGGGGGVTSTSLKFDLFTSTRSINTLMFSSSQPVTYRMCIVLYPIGHFHSLKIIIR